MERIKETISTTQVQPDLKSDPGEALSYKERLDFIKRLNALPVQQFNMLIYALNPPPGLIPPMPAAQSDRTFALLGWAEGVSGCGLPKVRQLVEEIITPLPHIPAEISHEVDLDIGDLTPKMCNRTEQEQQFNIFFNDIRKRRTGFPQIYIVHGGDRECHGSLVERFSRSSKGEVRAYAKRKYGEQKSAVELWDIEWPRGNDLLWSKKYLTYSLFKQFKESEPNQLNPDPAENIGTDISASAFREMVSSRKAVILVQHYIEAEKWNGITSELIRYYLKFWDDVRNETGTLQFLVFLNILYPSMEKNGQQTAWWNIKQRYQERNNRRTKERVEAELRKICDLPERKVDREDQCCSCVMLQELKCVDKAEVINWFRRHRIGSNEKYWENKCSEMFQQSECKSMIDIEAKLIEICKEIGNKKLKKLNWVIDYETN